MNLTKEDLIGIHELVRKRFKITPGIRSIGLVEAIVQRPDLVVNGKICFPDIYSKAASIMEAMRWHAFNDGNKRTLLLAAQVYLKKNAYFCLFPLKAIKFSVDISATQGEEQEVTDKLIDDISSWLKSYVAKRDDNDSVRCIILCEYASLQDLKKLNARDPQKAREMVNNWLAMDTYPENKTELVRVLDFIQEVNLEGLEDLEVWLNRKTD